MYEEDIEVAANVEETEEVETPTSPVEQVDQTKAFAKRLKEETTKAKLEAKEEIAKSFGYDSWDDYYNSQTNSKLLDKGLDPDSVRPVLEDLIKNDPQYIEAMKYKAEKEELEKEIFASNSIKALNEEMGTNFKNVQELGSQVIDLWNKGIPLAQAYAAYNYDKIRQNAIKKSNSEDNGKSHLKTLTGGNDKTQTRELTTEELSVFKSFGVSEERAKEYLKKQHQNKQ